MRSSTPRKPTGTDAEATYQKAAWEKQHGQEGRFVNSATVTWSQTSQGISAHAKQRKGGGSSPGTPSLVERFTIAALADIQGDYITCTPMVGTGPKVKIARPLKLRMSTASATLDGNVVTYSSAAYAGTDKFVRRDATLLSITEKQVIVPRYLVNDVIYAMKVTGGSGVTVAGVAVDYIDLNVDGRAWAFKADQTT